MSLNKTQLILAFLFISFKLFSQEPFISAESFNPDLYNGTIYNYSTSNNIKGNQYLESEEFTIGTITINDTTFTELFLNYDIYNQKILFKFQQNDITKIISIPKEAVSEFSVSNNHFVVLNEMGWDYKIYESIGNDDLRILLHWSKDIQLSNSQDVTDYTFTKAKRETYLYGDKKFNEIKSKGKFLSNFNEADKQEVKRFMKKNKINIKNSPSSNLLELVNFCNNI